MPKILCRCENLIDLTPIPCPDGFEMISEDEMNSLYSAPSGAAEDFIERFRRVSQQVYKCPYCGRLLVFWNKDQKATFYNLDPEAANPPLDKT